MARIRFWAIALVALMPAAASAQGKTGPSFDCASATQPIDKAICSDPELSALDAQLSERFGAAQAALPDRKSEVIQRERAWLKARNDECRFDDVGTTVEQANARQRTCLEGSYQEQLGELADPEKMLSTPKPARPDAEAPAGDCAETGGIAAAWTQSPRAAYEKLEWCKRNDVAHILKLFTTRKGADHDEQIRRSLADLDREVKDDASISNIGTQLASIVGTVDAKKYDGSAKSLVEVLGGMTFADPIELSCNAIARDNDLIALTTDMSGGSAIMTLASVECHDPNYSLPPEVSRYYAAIDALGSVSDVCGTIRGVYVAGDAMTRNIVQFAPSGGIQTGASNPPLPAKPLELWSLYDVWNFKKAQQVQNAYAEAVIALTRYYRTRFNEEEVQAHRNAIANLRDVGNVFTALPIPKDDFRYAVLHGESMAQVKKGYQAQRSDGFSSLNDQNINSIAASLHSETYEWNEIKAEWNEIKADLGDPEPPLLISILRPEVIAFLIAQHEPLEETNRLGKTALMTAAQFDQAASAKELLQAGAKVDQASLAPKDIEGNEEEPGCGDAGRTVNITHGHRTALMYAAENASLPLLRLLREHQADPCLKDSEGLTAWDYFDGRAPSKDRNPHIISDADKAETKSLLSCPAPKP